MTEERICPVMSRPSKSLEDILECIDAFDEFKVEKIVKDKSIQRVYEAMYVPCQRERCMAWYGGCDLAQYLDMEAVDPTCQAHGKDCPERPGSQCFGYCRLIEGDRG